MAFPVVATTASNVARGQNGGGVGNLKPTGLAVGDLLIAGASAVNGSNGNMTISAPATGSWTTIHTATNRGLFYKIADASDVAASDLKPQFSGGTNSSDACGAFVLRITGDSPTVVATNFADVSTTALSTSGITPVIQSLLLIVDVATINDATVRSLSGYAVANSNPSWNELLDNGISNSGTSSMHIAVASASETGAPGSATGNATATASLTENATIAIIAIQPSVIVATPIMLTTSEGTPSFTRLMVLTAISLTSSVGAAVASAVANLWTAAAKSAASWLNTPKS